MLLPFSEEANLRFSGGTSIKDLILTPVSLDHLSQVWQIFWSSQTLDASEVHLNPQTIWGVQGVAISDVYSTPPRPLEVFGQGYTAKGTAAKGAAA